MSEGLLYMLYLYQRLHKVGLADETFLHSKKLSHHLLLVDIKPLMKKTHLF